MQTHHLKLTYNDSPVAVVWAVNKQYSIFS